MKQKLMIISMAVAALLLSTESIQAQSRVVRRSRTEVRGDRNQNTDRRIRQEDPARSRRGTVVVAPTPAMRIVDNDVIRSFERERFDSNRLKMADMVFSTGGYMTVAQIVRVSEIFDFDSNRVKFLTSAYSNCVDRYNYYLVLATLDYSSSRDKVISYVMDHQKIRYAEGEPVRKMTSSDMNNIIRALKKEDFDSHRQKLAKMIVCGNLFTSRQIADMAKLFDYDSNRKEFLLYAYDNCVDPQNYLTAANTLDYSSNRTELMRKIGRR